MLDKPLMPKATAVWLLENTSLTFKQIADFCQLHELEIKGIADGDVASGIIGQNPILSTQLTEEEIKRCEADPQRSLILNKTASSETKAVEKRSKYTPIARRQDKPDGISYLLKTQEKNGFWDEPQFTATGFPRVFYLRYHGYSKFFPLWALARFRNLKASNASSFMYGM